MRTLHVLNRGRSGNRTRLLRLTHVGFYAQILSDLLAVEMSLPN